jgi:metallo-beta-lactamase class B
LIRDSVEKLGFHFNDVKIILMSHAHDDHAAGSALAKKLTGGKLMVMDADVAEVEAGGVGDFYYNSRWAPAKVDMSVSVNRLSAVSWPSSKRPQNMLQFK